MNPHIARIAQLSKTLTSKEKEIAKLKHSRRFWRLTTCGLLLYNIFEVWQLV